MYPLSDLKICLSFALEILLCFALFIYLLEHRMVFAWFQIELTNILSLKLCAVFIRT